MLQGTLFAAGEEVRLGPLAERARLDLGAGAWIDIRPRWVIGADALCDRLSAEVPWESERRYMYERIVDVPRLLAFYEEGEPLPDPALAEMREALGRAYREAHPEGFATVGLALYRDGRDSVAWHGDRIGRASEHDTLVAVVSLGAPRRFLLRPRGGGAAQKIELCSGDLLVMGGSCQRTFDHAVPKSARPVGPRVSVQFRPHGVR